MADHDSPILNPKALRRLRRARDFYNDNRNLLGTHDAFRKRLERRETNGLSAAGAVIESQLGLLVDPVKFREWLLRPRTPEAA